MLLIQHILFGIAAVSILVGSAVIFLLRRSLPQTSGTARVKGADAPIEIIRDEDAVTHIYAQSKRDAYFGQGYVHAQDRLWQMEFQRRIGQGRLSEILGKGTVHIDRFLRTLSVYRLVSEDWVAYPSPGKELIEAYVDGVNAFIDTHRGKLPPEFLILRFRPEPWTGPDVLVWAKMMAWNLSANHTAELLRRDIVKAVGEARAQELMAGYPEDGPTIVSPETLSNGNRDTREDVAHLVESVRSMMGPSNPTGAGLGSNSWIVDGVKSATGGAVLANDIHLGTGIPSIWYLAHLSGGDLDVIGATVPGLPTVLAGRNRDLAWGVTSMIADTQDLYREQLTPDGAGSRFDDVDEPVQQIVETIKVKGAPSVEHTVRVTRHGPLITDAVDRKDKEEEPEHLALKWVGLDSGDTTVQAFLNMNDARTCDEFRDAIAGFVTPPQDRVYADTAGNIGYHATGRIPIRKSGDGSVPADGTSDDNEWTGYIPFGELPTVYNPPRHFIATANNRPAPPDYPHFLGRDWEPPYRARRIADLLGKEEKVALAGHVDMQADTVSLLARDLLPDLLALVTPANSLEKQAVGLLDRWDANMTGDSVAGTIWAAWLRRLPRALAGDELGNDLVGAWESRLTHTSRLMASALSADGDRTGVAVKVHDAFRAAVGEIQTRLGSDPSSWRWDSLHSVLFPHQPFTHVRSLRRFFDRRVPMCGDESCLNTGPFSFDGKYEQQFASVYRQIIDLKDPDGGLFMHAPGQSGHFLSPHYSDYLDDWHNVRHRKMRFTRPSVDAGRRNTLWLKVD